MATSQLAPLLHYLRNVASPGASHEIADAELLSRFCRLRDEAAFTALVRRHGPMVFAVCRRVLRDAHTAEDAFQATFLVLARKADSLARPELLASWLHGVAYRTAIKARTEAVRRRTHEQQAVLAQEIAADDDPVWREVRAVLDDEVNRLPARYRVPVVLCYLQGQTNAEAARRLGCSRGTVATLLARARQKLRRRLTQRGVGLSVGVALTALVETVRGEAVPRALEQVTVKAATLLAAGQTSALGALAAHAVALAKGVSKAMLMEKLKFPMAILMVTAILGAGAGVTAYCVRADEGGVPQAEEEAKPQPVEKTERPRPPITAPSGEMTDKKATYRTTNFLVTAPSKEIAEKVGKLAEHHRKAQAQLWLGKELPTWDRPCPIRVTVTGNGSGGATEFAFDNGRILSINMHIEGPLDQLLASVLPHEITHTVLADYFGKPVPRWADEGAATLSENTASQAKYQRTMNKVVRSGHLLPLRQLLPQRDFPKDVMTFFTESYSLTDFLVTVGGRKKFLAFVTQGDDGGWEKAAKSIYHCESLDKLEQMWLGYARMRLADEPGDKPAREAPIASRQPQPVPAQDEAKAKHAFRGKLPGGPAPMLLLAIMDEDGRMTVGRNVAYYQPVSTTVKTKEGLPAVATKFVKREYVFTTVFDSASICVHDTKGRALDAKELRQRFKRETFVLSSADGHPIDPVHLRLYKEDTLIFVPPPQTPYLETLNLVPPPQAPSVQTTAPSTGAPAPVVASPVVVPVAPQVTPPPAVATPPAVPDAPQVTPPPVAAPPTEVAPPGAVPPPPQVMSFTPTATPTQIQTGSLKIATSSEGVMMQSGEVQGIAQRVLYDEAKGRLELLGNADFPAVLSRKRPGQQRQMTQARKIIYSLKDGKCEVSDVRSISEP